MSRRKQSNPKPLLKNDCENPIRDMTVLQQQQQPEQEQQQTEDQDQDDGVSFDEQGHSSTQENNVQQQDTGDDIVPSKEILDSPYSTENNSRPLSNCSTPAPAITPNKSSPDSASTRDTSISPNLVTDNLPKLRLNTTLAADPALQPEAKDIKCIRPSTTDKYNNQISCDEDGDDIQMDDDLPQSPNHRDNIKTASSHGQRDERLDATVSPSVDVLPRIPAFICAPCGIKFSSLSTLEAHQTYYCSHNKKDGDESNAAIKVSLSDDMSNAEPANKCIRTGKQYACTHCSYSADKKVSLNRHMRMHQTSPTPSSVTSNGDDCSSQLQQQVHQIDRYCSDCDIRFSSTKTYRAHKMHYCSTRHRDGAPSTGAPAVSNSKTVKGTDSSQSPHETPKSPPIIPPQPYVALPTSPIIIIPYNLIRLANVVPGPLAISPGVSNPDNTCFILQNGALQPIAQALLQTPVETLNATTNRSQTPKPTTNSVSNNNNDKSTHANNHVETIRLGKRKEGPSRDREQTSTPLDLSVRRLSGEYSQRERSISLSSSISSENHKSNIDSIMEGKENVSVNSDTATPEQIVCAPSLPGSPPLTPSPKRNSTSPRGILSTSPNSLLSSHHHLQQQHMLLRPLIAAELSAQLPQQVLSKQTLEQLALNISSVVSSGGTVNPVLSPKGNAASAAAAVAAAAAVNINLVAKKAAQNASATAALGGSTSSMPIGQPQIFVKQGVSKCKECNIVFCKFENYLAHKKHYCSARNLDDGKDGKSKPSPPSSPLGSNMSGGTGAYQQLICAACGIKFTSLDNLSAHQLYYCPKRIEIPVQQVKERCAKCKSIHDHSQPCPTSQNLFKCPICEVTSANAAESRRHLETHANLKAFKCSVCGYKGNTLRGMRTHIRMHFDKKSNDFNEENFISCIVEDEGSEHQVLPVPAASASNAINNTQSTSTAQSESSVSTQMHNCDKCNYSSSYKGNVVRHNKLVHSANNFQRSMSPTLGEGGESLIIVNEVPKPVSNTFSVIVKSEPDDMKSIARNNTTPTSIDTEPSPKIIKLEIHDSSDEISIQDDATDVAQPITVSDVSIKTSALPQLSNAMLPTSANSSTESKYCNICDIRFTYLSTYIAHKQYYCKSIKTDMDGATSVITTNASPTASVVTRTAETSVL